MVDRRHDRRFGSDFGGCGEVVSRQVDNVGLPHRLRSALADGDVVNTERHSATYSGALRVDVLDLILCGDVRRVITVVSFAAVGGSADWYITRGTGTVALILLTLSVALGVANVRRLRTAAMPRFVFTAVHRSVSLLALAFLLVHIATAVLDGYVPISVVSAVVPFTSPYRSLWLGLGAVAFDLLLAVTITSVLRHRFGHRAWRITHWAAYACWPIALIHGLGTGSDANTGWMLAIIAGCVAVTIMVVAARMLKRGTPMTSRNGAPALRTGLSERSLIGR